MEFTAATMDKLVDLLKEPEPDVLQGDDVTFSVKDEGITLGAVDAFCKQITHGLTNTHPEEVGFGYEITSNREKLPLLNKDGVKVPKTIEEYEEQEALDIDKLTGVGSGSGDRKTPEYNMNYQQSVTAEDVFLQIGPKTTSSASCENFIVKIKMPGDKKENVELSVDTKSVTVNSSQYFLNLPLPHEINPDNSKATWDSAEETLILTLKLDREFDFVNF